ncbi:polychome [Striga asiatica]|uniref:Polychome n=1 Tax=Striga asiatica TaxID=4170 RepID=A0A5A7NZU9_STRAF|nr:polychome [Striga asiatica]
MGVRQKKRPNSIVESFELHHCICRSSFPRLKFPLTVPGKKNSPKVGRRLIFPINDHKLQCSFSYQIELTQCIREGLQQNVGGKRPIIEEVLSRGNVVRVNSVAFVLEDEGDRGQADGTPFRWRDTAMAGTPGVALGRGSVGNLRSGRVWYLGRSSARITGLENFSPLVGSGRGRALGSTAIERRRAHWEEGEGLSQTESPLLEDRIRDPSASTLAVQLENDLSMISPHPTIGLKHPHPTIGKVPKILLDIANNQEDGDSCKTPQKKLLENIDTVEKVVMEKLRKLKGTPSAKKAEREKRVRTLLRWLFGWMLKAPEYMACLLCRHCVPLWPSHNGHMDSNRPKARAHKLRDMKHGRRRDAVKVKRLLTYVAMVVPLPTCYALFADLTKYQPILFKIMPMLKLVRVEFGLRATVGTTLLGVSFGLEDVAKVVGSVRDGGGHEGTHDVPDERIGTFEEIEGIFAVYEGECFTSISREGKCGGKVRAIAVEKEICAWVAAN